MQSKRDWSVKALTMTIVLQIKYYADGSIKRYRTRFLILENMQVHGDSYDKAYAPVASMASVKLFINYAAKLGLHDNLLKRPNE